MEKYADNATYVMRENAHIYRRNSETIRKDFLRKSLTVLLRKQLTE
jgi:hypothetical protein